MKAKTEKFEIIQIPRSQIKNAPYNPRVISKEARKKLKRGIKKYGLVEPLVWNKRTGNLVSGHQRLSILDEIEGEKNYELTVAVIDIPESEEKKLNVFLNNSLTQGDWDYEKLSELIESYDDPSVFGDLGFTPEEIAALCPTEKIMEMIEKTGAELDNEKVDPMAKEKSYYDKLYSTYMRWKEDIRKKDDAEFYLIIVFPDREKTDKFIELLNLDPNNRYQDGLFILQRLNSLLGNSNDTHPGDKAESQKNKENHKA